MSTQSKIGSLVNLPIESFGPADSRGTLKTSALSRISKTLNLLGAHLRHIVGDVLTTSSGKDREARRTGCGGQHSKVIERQHVCHLGAPRPLGKS